LSRASIHFAKLVMDRRVEPGDDEQIISSRVRRGLRSTTDAQSSAIPVV
jgi:hypothetical protein